MRYWAYLIAKVVVAAGLMVALFRGLVAVWPRPEPVIGIELSPFARDLGFTTAVMILFLVAVGLGYLIVLDQRFRCRTCLRRLRMPLLRGGWNHLLLGAPRTEYICPYGHGTLRVPELDSGEVNWKPIDDMWKELEDLAETRK